MYTSNIIKGRTCKDWGTVYDKSSEALLRFRNDTQRDGNEDDTVEMDNIQNRKYGEDGTLITFKKKVQINRDDNEDKNEDDVQDENANETPSVEDDTTIDHKDLENENGINEVTTTKNIIIVTHLTSVRSVCGGGSDKGGIYGKNTQGCKFSINKYECRRRRKNANKTNGKYCVSNSITIFYFFLSFFYTITQVTTRMGEIILLDGKVVGFLVPNIFQHHL